MPTVGPDSHFILLRLAVTLPDHVSEGREVLWISSMSQSVIFSHSACKGTFSCNQNCWNCSGVIADTFASAVKTRLYCLEVMIELAGSQVDAPRKNFLYHTLGVCLH